MADRNHRNHRNRGIRAFRGQGKNTHRQERLEQLIHQELDGLLRFEVADPTLEDVGVSYVELTPDLRNSQIGWSLQASEPPDDRQIVRIGRALDKASGFFRAKLSDALGVHRLPQLRFVYDARRFSTSRLEALFEQIHADEEPEDGPEDPEEVSNAG